VGKEVAAHSACWATATGLREGKLAETTPQRWQQFGVGRVVGRHVRPRIVPGQHR
jgi:hypothetical protein